MDVAVEDDGGFSTSSPVKHGGYFPEFFPPGSIIFTPIVQDKKPLELSAKSTNKEQNAKAGNDST